MKIKIIIATILVAFMLLGVMSALPAVQGNVNSMSPSSGMGAGMGFSGTITNHFHSRGNYGAKLNYNYKNNTVYGQYLKLNYKNGYFSNITYNPTGTMIISNMYANSSLTSSHITNPLFNSGSSGYSPINTLGSLMVYYNYSTFIVMHNNPALESNIMIHGTYFHINAPSGAKIYNTTNNMQVSASANASLNAQANSTVFGNASMSVNVMANFNHVINAGKNMIIIDNNGTVAFIFVHNGKFVIKSQNITIMPVNGTAFINIVVPPGMQKVPVNTTLTSAILKGKIASEIALEKVNGTLENNTVNYNSSINFKFDKNTTSNAVFDVNSTVNHATIVAIFISNNVLKNNGNAYVKFDGSVAKEVNVSTLLNETSTTTPYYSYVNTSSGMFIMLYVPHFSNHVIEVSNVPFTSYTMYYIIIGVIVIIAIIGSVIYIERRKK